MFGLFERCTDDQRHRGALDRDGIAEMSCIGGVGGDVGPLVETATSGQDVVVIDGCPLTCAKSCLEQHDVSPDRHDDLSQEGVAKEYHTDYDDDQAEAIRALLVEDVEDLKPA